ncbi:MAG TPA: alpha/beta hydrolase, partial [Emticicia sp.]
LFIEYGLAPENPFPVGRNEVIEVYKELLISFPETNIILIGDSAGGGLTVSSVYAMIESELKLPARVMLISPWINLRCNTDSYESRKHLETILTKEGLLKNAAYYAGDNLKSADTSQLVFNSFPPVIILVGSNEILFDDSKNFYESIKAVQPNAQMKEYEGQAHVWMLTDIHSEAAKEALEDMNAFVRSLNH